MAVSAEYLAYAQEQMGLVSGILARRMFGGVGFSVRGRMFALLADDVLYLKTDDSNRSEFEAAGMGPFVPFAEKRTQTMPYYEVPAEVLEDRTELAAWVRKAIVVAYRAAAAKKRPAKKTVGKKK